MQLIKSIQVFPFLPVSDHIYWNKRLGSSKNSSLQLIPQVIYVLEFMVYLLFHSLFLYTSITTYLLMESNSTHSERKQEDFSLQTDPKSHSQNSNCTHGTSNVWNLRSRGFPSNNGITTMETLLLWNNCVASATLRNCNYTGNFYNPDRTCKSQ